MAESLSPSWYPEFAPGQVITAEELNHLGLAIREHIQFQTRLFGGFGIVRGLEGKMVPDEEEWELSSGEAIDCLGRRIVVPQPIRINVCNPSFDESSAAGNHPHIKPVEGFPLKNFTPVLVFRIDRRTNPSDEIGDEVAGNRMIDSHKLIMVPGRLSPGDMPDVYKLKPIQLPEGLVVVGGVEFSKGFYHLRDSLVEALQRLELPSHSLHRLRRLRLIGKEDSGVLEASDVLSIALLNEILYTAWQFARADQYLKLHGDHECASWMSSGIDAESGVPLGWIYQHPQYGWCWDSRWRCGFVVGLSLLKNVHEYDPVILKSVCKKRIVAALEETVNLRGLLPPNSYEAKQLKPDLWKIDPLAYHAGTKAWLRSLGWDRARKWSKFWPIDPLRGPVDAPLQQVPNEAPGIKSRLGENTPYRISRPSPSLLDPNNDPYYFSAYAEVKQLDPGHTGLIALAGLLEHPVDQVKAKLEALYEQNGVNPSPLMGVIRDSEGDKMGGLEYCLMASLLTPLFIICSQNTNAVIGFGSPIAEVDRAIRIQRAEQWIGNKGDRSRNTNKSEKNSHPEKTKWFSRFFSWAKA